MTPCIKCNVEFEPEGRKRTCNLCSLRKYELVERLRVVNGRKDRVVGRLNAARIAYDQTINDLQKKTKQLEADQARLILYVEAIKKESDDENELRLENKRLQDKVKVSRESLGKIAVYVTNHLLTFRKVPNFPKNKDVHYHGCMCTRQNQGEAIPVEGAQIGEQLDFIATEYRRMECHCADLEQQVLEKALDLEERPAPTKSQRRNMRKRQLKVQDAVPPPAYVAE